MFSYVTFVLSLFGSDLAFWCLGKTALRDCDMFCVSSLVVWYSRNSMARTSLGS